MLRRSWNGSLWRPLLLAAVAGLLTACGSQKKAARSVAPAVKLERQEYIRKYAPLAIEEMERTGIPASITMAQALLESDNGNSYLAVYGKNHFGIKCHDDWTGKRIYYDDDARHECFRKYNDVEESYRDHSDFLRTKRRYAFLFELDPTDYKAWAHGLKKAGYATNPHYAGLLIRIIEENRLYELDRAGMQALREGRVGSPPSGDRTPAAAQKRDTSSRPVVSAPLFPASAAGDEEFVVTARKGHQVLINNRVNYIIVKPGDTFESLTRELGLVPGELPRYNELEPDAKLVPGQILYLQPKRKQAELGKKEHVVKEGETMYSISQRYAIKLKYLYQMNNMRPGEEPEPGQHLKLRK